MAAASCVMSRWSTTSIPNNPRPINGNTMLRMFTNKIHRYRCSYQHDISRFCFVNLLIRIPWSWSNDPSLVYWKSYHPPTTNPSLVHKHHPPHKSELFYHFTTIGHMHYEWNGGKLTFKVVSVILDNNEIPFSAGAVMIQGEIERQLHCLNQRMQR